MEGTEMKMIKVVSSTVLVVGGLVGATVQPASAGAAADYCGIFEVTAYVTPGVDFVGGAGRDVILGTSGPDVIRGMDGNDVICGEGGRDEIHGNQGLDEIYGGTGGDTIKGGYNDDTIYGEGGPNSIDCGDFGEAGGDFADGGSDPGAEDDTHVGASCEDDLNF